MSNSKAREYLKHFVFSKNPQFAVMINGKWGCGKTWFVNNVLEQVNIIDALYVSLYGLEKTSDIDDEFYRQLHPVLSSKTVNLGAKILKGLLKATIRLDLDGDGKSETSVNTKLPDISHKEIDEYIDNAKDRIIVFDDLERCSMNIEVTLGYINSLVEHLKYTVIVICNESELGGSSGNEKYQYVREKLVGKTLSIEPDAKGAIENFISEVCDDEYHMFLRKDETQEIIGNTFSCSKTDNLRQLRKAIIEYEWLFKMLPESAHEKQGLIIQIFSIYLALSLEYSSKEYVDDKFMDDMAAHGPESYMMFGVYRSDEDEEDEEEKENPFQNIRDKYMNIDFVGSPLGYELWQDVLVNGLPEEDVIKTSVESSSYYPEDMPAWKKLWYRYDIDDEQFSKCLNEVLRDLNEHKITSKELFLHVSGVLVTLSKANLMDSSVEEVVSSAKEYINWMIENKHISPSVKANMYPQYDRETAYGMGYSSAHTSEFREIINYLDESLRNESVGVIKEVGEELLEEFENDLEIFSTKVVQANSGENIYYDVPVMADMPADRMGDLIISHLEKGNNNARLVFYVFQNRWKHFNDKIGKEKEFLKALRKYLLERSAEENRTLSRFKIEEFVKNSLDKSIDLLEGAERIRL